MRDYYAALTQKEKNYLDGSNNSVTYSLMILPSFPLVY